MTSQAASDEQRVEQARAMLAPDNPWQERVAAATLLGSTDPDSDAGRTATTLLADLCLHDPQIELITEAAYQLMSGGRERVLAYVDAWSETDGAVTGWMDNCILRFPSDTDAADRVLDLEDSARTTDEFELARDWLIYHAYERVPPELAAEWGWSADDVARHDAVVRGDVQPVNAQPWPTAPEPTNQPAPPTPTPTPPAQHTAPLGGPSPGSSADAHDEQRVEQARAMLAADNPWQERVAAATLLGRTDPTSDAGREATRLLADLCVNDPLIELITQAAYELMRGGRQRVAAYVEAWSDTDTSGWMDNSWTLFPDNSYPAAIVRDLMESTSDRDEFEYARDWLMYHDKEPIPPELGAELGWSAEDIVKQYARVREESVPPQAPQ